MYEELFISQSCLELTMDYLGYMAMHASVTNTLAWLDSRDPGLYIVLLNSMIRKLVSRWKKGGYKNQTLTHVALNLNILRRQSMRNVCYHEIIISSAGK